MSSSNKPVPRRVVEEFCNINEGTHSEGADAKSCYTF